MVLQDPTQQNAIGESSAIPSIDCQIPVGMDRIQVLELDLLEM